MVESTFEQHRSESVKAHNAEFGVSFGQVFDQQGLQPLSQEKYGFVQKTAPIGFSSESSVDKITSIAMEMHKKDAEYRADGNSSNPLEGLASTMFGKVKEENVEKEQDKMPKTGIDGLRKYLGDASSVAAGMTTARLTDYALKSLDNSLPATARFALGLASAMVVGGALNNTIADRSILDPSGYERTLALTALTNGSMYGLSKLGSGLSRMAVAPSIGAAFGAGYEMTDYVSGVKKWSGFSAKGVMDSAGKGALVVGFSTALLPAESLLVPSVMTSQLWAAPSFDAYDNFLRHK